MIIKEENCFHFVVALFYFIKYKIYKFKADVRVAPTLFVVKGGEYNCS